MTAVVGTTTTGAAVVGTEVVGTTTSGAAVVVVVVVTGDHRTGDPNSIRRASSSTEDIHFTGGE